MITVAFMEMASQSPYLTAGVLLLLTAVALTVLKGLISLAKRIAIIGGVGLLLYGAVSMVAPGILPAII